MGPGLTLSIAVVSPHPDDAALSIGGILARKRCSSISIVTCFSESCSIETTDTDITTKVRLAEDEAYVEFIGARLVRLGFPDTNVRTNVGRYPVDSTAEGLLREKLCGDLRSALSKIEYDLVFVPSAIGAHADHEHCKVAALQSCDSQTLMFYEDLPYAQFDGGADLIGQRLGAQFWHLEAREIELTRAEINLKLRGLDFYGSQIPPSWRRDVERYASAIMLQSGAYAERLWVSPLSRKWQLV